jgi:hypothetical protein
MRLGGERGALQLGIAQLAALAIGIGVVVGGGLYAAGVGTTDSVEIALDTVPFSTCPDSEQIGDFHRGDRVLTTARDESGDWLQLRDPRNLDARVWVIARYVIPDDTTKDLPVATCRPPGEIGSGPTTTTTTTTPSNSGTTPSTSGTTLAPDTTPPTIGAGTASPALIYTSPCASGSTPTTSQVSVPVTDAGGVASVTIAWTLANRSGQVTASLVSGQYQGTVGPFPNPVATTLPKKTNLTITALDSFGNQSQSTANTILTVNACPI